MTAIALTELTQGTVAGTGIFDALMRASKAHLDAEFNQSRIRGPEYSQVYLGQLQAVMSTALSFLAQRDKLNLEAQLLEKQLLLADKQLEQADAQIALTGQQLINAQAEKLQTEAQTELIKQQKINSIKELEIITANVTKITAEVLNIPKQGAMIDAQKDNEVLQGKVLVAQECLLKAQFDGTVQTTLKSASETDLLKQKIVTEKAQTMELGVDDNSVIGRQKQLYAKQSAGFDRDAEQKAAQLWVSSWNSRRMTDEGTVADSTNKLDDTTGGRLMTKLLAGVNA